MVFTLYQVTEQGILTSKRLSFEDIALVFDDTDKKIYVWKGPDSRNIDEFSSKRLYESILTRFLNPDVFIIKALESKDGDSEQVIKIKNYIADKLPDYRKYKGAKILKDIFYLRKVRENIKTFNEYKKSNKWKSRLSNLTNIRKLSIFNVVSILVVAVMLIIRISIDMGNNDLIFVESGNIFNPEAFELWQTYLFIILSSVLIILGVNFVANLLFVLFPLRWPIDPATMRALSYEDIDNLKDLFLPELKKPRQDSPEIAETTTQKLPEISVPKLPPTKVSIPHTKEKKETKKIDISIPKLPPKPKSKSKEVHAKKSKTNKPKMPYEADDDADLGIPAVPLRKVVKIDKKTLKGQPILEKDSKDPNVKTILVECKICGKPIKMPVPRKIIEDSDLPVTDVTYVHGDPPHAVTAQLDRDFAVRRRRCAEVIFQKIEK